MPNETGAFEVSLEDSANRPVTGQIVKAVGVDDGRTVLLENDSIDGIPNKWYLDRGNACGATNQDVYWYQGSAWEFLGRKQWAGNPNTRHTFTKAFSATDGQATYDLGRTVLGVSQVFQNGLGTVEDESLWTLSSGRYVVLGATLAAQIMLGDKVAFVCDV